MTPSRNPSRSNVSSGQSRREFLRGLAGLAPALSLGLWLPGCSRQVDHASGPEQTVETLDRYTTLFFTENEWRFLLAASDRLIPGDAEGPGALAAYVPIFIDRQMAGDYGEGASWYLSGPFQPDAAPDRGYQLGLKPKALYRLGIQETEAHCRRAFEKSFVELTEDEKDSVLSELEGGHITLPSLPAATFFNTLLQNVKEGYFADPMHGGNKDMGPWKMIGYPGARASYLEWVEQYQVPYPLGPVSISGGR